jgi:hypothetical protein
VERVYRALLIVATLAGSWLGLQVVHESGHVLGAWVTLGRVERVILHPLAISRTDVTNSNRPLVVVWMGPIVGALLPLLLWSAIASAAAVLRSDGDGFAWSLSYVLRFFAGACLVANGLYLGIGSFYRVGDCGDLLQHGARIWQLWLFGAATVPLGLFLWHNLGGHFGLGPKQSKVNRAAALVSTSGCLVLIVFEIIAGGW